MALVWTLSWEVCSKVCSLIRRHENTFIFCTDQLGFQVKTKYREHKGQQRTWQNNDTYFSSLITCKQLSHFGNLSIWQTFCPIKDENHLLQSTCFDAIIQKGRQTCSCFSNGPAEQIRAITSNFFRKLWYWRHFWAWFKSSFFFLIKYKWIYFDFNKKSINLDLLYILL